MSKTGWNVYHKPTKKNGVWTIKQMDTVTGEETYHEYTSKRVADEAYQSLIKSIWAAKS
ncbi:hypothetical protein [Allopusillimonas ginsengisoli]|uniref:hypothetical protein n=1 Tax=Allopusillimonas ginsengisoli TaxID=453575 RepID=UPI001431105D|nr:hypothetical protein [Allopusillimonas ginsengisoli]